MFSEKLFKEIFESKAPNKLLIVPAQLTLAAEEAAFKASGKEGFFDFAVMSGNKLRQEIVAKTGGSGRTPINTIGQNLILRKSLRDLELDVFKKSSINADFIKAASDFILQSKQNENSAKNALAVAPDGLLKRKLLDLSKIEESYGSYMKGAYLDSADGLAFAISKVKESNLVKSSEIWFDGFYSFNKEEESFLEELKKYSLGLHVNLISPKEEFPETLEKIYEAEDPEDEALFVAAEAMKLIREGLKADDILILSASYEEDKKLYKRVFESLGLKIYIDEKKSLAHIKEVGKVISLLDMAANGFRTTSVISFVDDPDFTNYVKKYHVKPNQFEKSFMYGGEDKIAAEIKRDEFISLTSSFFTSLKEKETAKEKCVVLYTFLTDTLHMPEALEERAKELFESYPEISEEYSQVWDILVSLMDQIVELLGDVKVDAEEFCEIFRFAFMDISIGVLPEERGKISFGDLYRVRPYGAKALFITSFNEGSVPRKLGKETILSLDEAEKLAALDSPLVKTSRQLSKEDYIVIYDAMENANRLFVSYSLATLEGLPKEAAYILKKKSESFGVSPKEKIYTVEGLSEELRSFKETGNFPEIDYQVFANEYKDRQRIDSIKKGLLYKNNEWHLSKDNRDLLGLAKLSPSKIEKFARCPFSYFALYGLGVKETEEFKLNSTDIGNIHHEVLSRLSRYLSSDGKKVSEKTSLWQTITEQEIKDFVTKTVNDIRVSDNRGLYQKGSEEEYYLLRELELAKRFATKMVNQVRLGNIDKIVTEENFEFTFKGVNIYGKIDRLDTTNLSTTDLVKVIDYKTGAASFDEELIRKGLAVQLMLYLEVATSKGAKPIGTFYFKVQTPESKTAIESLALSELLDETVARLEGAFVAEELAFGALDKTVSLGDASAVVNKNKGLTELEYEELRSKFRESLEETITKMQSGSVAISPSRLGSQNTSCTYCPYKMVCEFDVETEGFSYNA